jgi:hypothetical protein
MEFRVVPQNVKGQAGTGMILDHRKVEKAVPDRDF